MKKILLLSAFLLLALSCGQSNNKLIQRAEELCEYIPDHVLLEEAKDYMTADFFMALSEAFDAPVDDYSGIGDNEWLFYFVTGNGGSSPSFSVLSVDKVDKANAVAKISVRQIWEDGQEAEEEEEEYLMNMTLENGEWLLSDFDGKKQECVDYVKDMRAKYASGEIIDILASDDFTREYIPDFKARVEAFYEKYGR